MRIHQPRTIAALTILSGMLLLSACAGSGGVAPTSSPASSSSQPAPSSSSATPAPTSPTATPTESPTTGSGLPKGVLGADSQYPYAVPVGSAAPTTPVLQVWEDFQCPACKMLEDYNGKGIESIGLTGKAQLLYRPTIFLDDNLKNDSSARATNAWGCAIDAGKTVEYHNTIFAHQPEKEGTGYTDAQLLEFGKEVGISGTAFDTFTTCVTNNTYADWVAKSFQAFINDNIPGTPAIFLNGNEVPVQDAADQQKLESLVAAAS